MFRLVSVKVLRYWLVPVLSLWIAGAGCLFGCELRVQAGTPESVEATSPTDVTESCASANSHDCCARKGPRTTNEPTDATSNDSGLALTEINRGPSGSMRECPLAINATAVIAKTGHEQTKEFVPNQPIPAVLSQVVQHQYPLIDALPVPNRGPTYLRCCAFLI